MRRTTLWLVPRRVAAGRANRDCGGTRPTAPPACATNRSGSTPPRWPTHSELLLSRSMNLLDVVEDLLQRRAVGHRLEDRCHAQIRVGREVRHPAIGLAHPAPHRSPRPPVCQVARNVLYFFTTSRPSREKSPVCQPGSPQRFGQVDPVLLPYFGGRPRPFFWPGSTTGGNDHKAASHRSRLITVTPAPSTRFKNGRLT